MGLFTGAAPPDISSTQTTASTTPSYYTDYLTKLSQAGQGALGTFDPTTNKFTPPTQESLIAAGKPYVAGLTQAQKDVFANAPEQLTRYQTPLDEALTAGKAGAGVSQADIDKFYNPYEKSVVDAMATNSMNQYQKNILPQLKAGFVGTGGLGGQRYANAAGQTVTDMNTALLQEQNKARMAGYNTALDAALKEAGMQTQASAALTGLGSAEQQAATTGLKTGADLGALEQAYTQSQINAPLTQASNVAALMKGYTVPTTQTQTYKGPGSAYQPSPLSQIASLGTLLASGFNKDNSGWGNLLLKNLGSAGSISNADKAINEYFKSSGSSPFDVMGPNQDTSGNTSFDDWLQQYTSTPASNVED